MQAPAVGVLLAPEFVGEEPSVSLDPFEHRRFRQGELSPERAVV
jgi:hypothetical protein